MLITVGVFILVAVVAVVAVLPTFFDKKSDDIKAGKEPNDVSIATPKTESNVVNEQSQNGGEDIQKPVDNVLLKQNTPSHRIEGGRLATGWIVLIGAVVGLLLLITMPTTEPYSRDVPVLGIVMAALGAGAIAASTMWLVWVARRLFAKLFIVVVWIGAIVLVLIALGDMPRSLLRSGDYIWLILGYTVAVGIIAGMLCIPMLPHAFVPDGTIGKHLAKLSTRWENLTKLLSGD